MYTFGEGGQRGCEQQGERACATWQSDFRDRDKTYKTKSSVSWGGGRELGGVPGTKSR